MKGRVRPVDKARNDITAWDRRQDCQDDYRIVTETAQSAPDDAGV